MIKRDRLWCNLLIMVTALGSLLAACGGGEETSMPDPVPTVPAAPGKPDTIRFAVYDWQRAAYEDLVEAFEETNPGLHVQLVDKIMPSIEEISDPLNWSDWEMLWLSTADVVEMQVYPGGTTVEMGLIRDLTPFIEADSNFQSGDFYPGVLERYQWDGGIWALPTAIDVPVICYDKEAFDEAGVPYPEPGWTWEDFVTKARALTMYEGEKVTRWGYARSFLYDDPWPFIEGRVGSLVDTSTDPPTLRLDQPEVIEAVRWYTDLHLKDQVIIQIPCSEKADGGFECDSRALYNSGVAAMWGNTFTGWRKTTGFGEVSVVPFPVDTPDSQTTPLQTTGLVMSAGTRYPNVAWRWMDFLSLHSTSAWGGSYLPARRSVAEESGFEDTLNEEVAAALNYALNHSYARLGLENQAVRKPFRWALDVILKGEKSVEEALAEAQVQAMAKIWEDQERLAEILPAPPFAVATPEEESAPDVAVEITFTPGVDSHDLQRYRQLAERFQQTHPGISVEVEPAPSSYLRDLQIQASAADCFLGYPNIQDPENRTAILDLSPFLDTDPSFTIGDFYPTLLEPFTWQGQLWGLPIEVETYVIEYNKDLFDDAGLNYPASDWTIDEFLPLARALTQGEGEARQYGFAPEAYEGYVLPLILERLGAELIDESTDPPAVHFDDPSTAKALGWYVELATVHDLRPIFVTDLAELAEGSSSEGEREEMIEDGRVAMWVSSGVGSAMAHDRDGLRVGVVPFPIGSGGAGGYRSPKGYFISAQAEAPQVCWEWITFLTGQPEAAQGLPARRPVAESEAYWQQVGEERAVAYRASVAGLERPFQLSSEAAWLRGVTYWLFQAYGRVLEGRVSVEEALRDAQRKADEYRICVVAHNAFYHQEEWQVCSKEVDPTLPDFLFGEEE